MKEMTIRDIQMVSLDILKDVHNFCIEHNIQYSLCGGSLIGAIRHNGFIPWDDDVYIIMPRPEYDRFINTYKSEKGYQLFSHEVENGENVRLRITKICDMKKTFVEKGPNVWTDVDTGIGIDIIPADGAPDTQEEANRHIKKLRLRSKLIIFYCAKFAPLNGVKRLNKTIDKIKFFIKKIGGLFVNRNCITSFIKFQKKFSYEQASYFCGGFKYGKKEWLPKNILEAFVLHKFEDTEFFVSEKYDLYLTRLFGDYMKLPPDNRRESHDNIYHYYWKD